MNLEDVIDINSGLCTDEWSLSRPTFGNNGQLEVIGWSYTRHKSRIKSYVCKCIRCSTDPELFGEGYFRMEKSRLLSGSMPCGCSKNIKWNKDQYHVLCKRKAEELGYLFLGFKSEPPRSKDLISLSCKLHGEWNTTTLGSFLSVGSGCTECRSDLTAIRSTKPDDVMIQSFFNSGSFSEGTIFKRSLRKDSKGRKVYWHVWCPLCNSTGEITASDLQHGNRSCACSVHRQQQAYINWIIDKYDSVVAIKVGISRDSKQRIKQQDSKSVYTLKQHSVYTFPSVQQCKQAERECKKELQCGIVLKRDMPDGYSETTWVYNLEKVIDIYERNGGLLVE